MSSTRELWIRGWGCGLLASALAVGCAPSSSSESASSASETTSTTGEAAGLSWWADARPLVLDKCARCHVEGGIGPFALEHYAQVLEFADLVRESIEEGSMPPWPPSPSCNEYSHDRSLDEGQRELLLSWLEAGAPEGDPAEAPPAPEPPPPWQADLSLELPEPYTPPPDTDDYRCFLIDAPELDESVFITGFDATPGDARIVHHVVTYIAEPGTRPTYEALDEADPGPGYRCFGSTGGEGLTTRWAGSWTPGSQAWQAPAGTGIEVEPGSTFIVQVHYSPSLGASLSDQSRVELSLAESVERPAMILAYTDIAWVQGTTPMTIPAGESAVVHSLDADRDHPILNLVLAQIGVYEQDTIMLSNANLHMHLLGERASLTVTKGAEELEQCVLAIDDYDFNWQGSYDLAEPVAFGPGDRMTLTCEWDNSASNQPLVDGVPREPVDVAWGDGSFDEMCIGLIYVYKQ